MAIVKYGVELNDIKKEMDAKIGNKVQEINQRLETHIAETAKNETNSNTDSI